MRHVAEHHGGAGLPLSEPVLLILLSLCEEARHGYAILKDVEEVSLGRVRLSTGTLYGAIRRLLDAGWIERVVEDEAPRERQTYRLTGAGRDLVRAEMGRMKMLVRAGTLRLNQGEV